MKKTYLSLALSFALFTACGGSTLVDQNNNPNPNATPSNSLFAQVEFGPKDSGSEFETTNYHIQLSNGGIAIANVQWLQASGSAPVAIRAYHEGEDHSSGGESESHDDDGEHSEPTQCNFTGSMNAALYLDLLESSHLPCVTVPQGNYAGLQFSFVDPSTGVSVQNLPEGQNDTLRLEGTAVNLTTHTTYPFVFAAKLNQNVRLEKALVLNAEGHHLEIKVELAEWFHGLDFATLDQRDGVVRLDSEHNAERFEHMVEHLLGSFSLEN